MTAGLERSPVSIRFWTFCVSASTCSFVFAIICSISDALLSIVPHSHFFLYPSAFHLIRRLQSSPYLYTVSAAASLSQMKCAWLWYTDSSFYQLYRVTYFVKRRTTTVCVDFKNQAYTFCADHIDGAPLRSRL